MITILNEIGKQWLEYFGFFILQNTVFLGILFLVLYLLKNASARVKHVIATIGLVKLLLPPFIPLFIPGRLITPLATSINGLGENVTGAAVNSANVLTMEAFLFIVWMSLVVGITLSFLFSMFKFKILLTNSLQLKIDNYPVLKTQKTKLFQSDKISMPLSCGLFSKKIYVPKIWDEWDSECQHFILVHEIAHLKRRDNWLQILQMASKAIYFFHPLVWYLNHRMDELREMACDEVTTAGNQNYTIQYSRYLVEIAETSLQTQLGYISASALIRQKKELLNRVKHLMEDNMKHLSKRKFLIILVGLLAISLPLSIFSIKKDAVILASDQSDKAPNMVLENPPEGTVGKIYGKIIDENSGEAINGVTITLAGTRAFARTDNDGYYFLIHVPPGKYTVAFSKDGYLSVVFKDVRVVIKKTTTLDGKMEKAIIE